jgi:hypothetical protein
MNPRPKTSAVCDEIAGELRDISTWLSSGRLDPETFRQAVLALEQNKVKRHGYTLSGTHAHPGLTRFTLRCAASGNVCAEMTFNPATGELVREMADEAPQEDEEPNSLSRPRF